MMTWALRPHGARTRGKNFLAHPNELAELCAACKGSLVDVARQMGCVFLPRKYTLRRRLAKCAHRLGQFEVQQVGATRESAP